MIPVEVKRFLIKKVIINGKITKEDLESPEAALYYDELINSGKIKEVSEGEYLYVDAKDITDYITFARSIRDYYYANAAIKYYATLKPEFDNVNMSALMTSIQGYDFISVYRFYKNLVAIKGNTISDNQNLFLYFLSFLTELSEEDKEKAKKFIAEELYVSSANPEASEINEIIYDFYKGRRKKALNACLKRKVRGHDTELDILLTYFLSAIYNQNLKLDAQISALADKKEYEKIMELLKKESYNHRLGFTNRTVWFLASLLSSHAKGEEIYSLESRNANSVGDAIVKGEYYYALELCWERHNDRRGVPSVTQKLLESVCEEAKTRPEDDEEEKEKLWNKVLEELQSGLAILPGITIEGAKSVVSKNEDEKITVNYLRDKYLIVKSTPENIEYDEQKAFMSAKKAYENGEYAEAMGIYKLIIRASSTINLQAYALLALCFYNMQDYENASLYFDIASETCKARKIKNPYLPLVIALRGNEEQIAPDRFIELEKTKMASEPSADLVNDMVSGIYTSSDPRDYSLDAYEENRALLKAIEESFALGNIDIANILMQRLQASPYSEYLKDELSMITGKTRIYKIN